MKAFNMFVVALVCAFHVSAADVLTEKLQRGLFEEEANHNLDAAIKEYQSVVAQSDEQRKAVATALFRLGECYRKLGRTNDADAQFRRILSDFSEQDTLMQLSSKLLHPGNIRASAADTPAIEKRLAELRAELVETQAPYDTLRVLTRDQLLQTLPRMFNDPVLAELQTQANNAEQKLASLRTSFGDDHPDVRATTEVLKVLRKQIDDRLAGDLNGMKIRAEAAASKVKAMEAEAQRTQSAVPATISLREPVTQAEADDLARVKTLARNSPDLLENSPNSSFNQLQAAASKGYYSVVEFLVAQGVNLDAAGSGNTPLVIAAQGGHLRIVKLLVEHGAEINPKNHAAGTALMAASSFGYQSILSYLIEHGADVNYTTSWGGTALLNAVASDHLNTVEILLAHGAKTEGLASGGYNLRSTAHSMDVQSGTPLHRAVANKNHAIAELLLRAGANVNATNYERQTPLHLAAFLGNSNTVALLLDKGAEVEPVSTAGRTPFAYALSERNKEVMTLLLQRGANPNQMLQLSARPQLTFGGTAAPSGEPTPALFAAIWLGPPELLSALLAAKPDLNVMTPEGTTPLFAAIGTGMPKMVETLLKAGVDPNETNRNGDVPLVSATMNGNGKMVEALLNYKADPNLVNARGQSALGVAHAYATLPPYSMPPGWMPGAPLGSITPEVKTNAMSITNLLQQHGARPLPTPTNAPSASSFADQLKAIQERALQPGVPPRPVAPPPPSIEGPGQPK